VVRVGILGHFARGLKLYDGQTIKTLEMFEELSREGFDLMCADTYYMKRSFTTFMKELYRLFSGNDRIIICLSWNGYSKILPVLIFLNIIYKRKLYDVVIGGNRQEYFAKSKFYRSLARNLACSYVESKEMVAKYNEYGLHNVKYMPNFKNLQLMERPTPFKRGQQLPLCTFSRVCKEKGIEDAIDAVKNVNIKIGYNRYSLTIFGFVEVSYKKQFEKLKNNFPEYIKYGGVISYDDSARVLKDYFLLLFPTYWDGEGFPGTLIDALAAGLPAIVSDWSFNSEIVINKKTGFITSVHNINEIVGVLMWCSNNIYFVEQMRNNCLLKMKEYLPMNALEVLKKDLLACE